MPLRRRLLLAALAAGVTLAHLWLAMVAMPPQLGAGAAERGPRRIAVDFVRQLVPAAPAAAPARPRGHPLRRLAASLPALAASAAQGRAPLPVLAEEAPLADVPELEPLAPTALESPLPSAAPPASAAAAQAFEWPPSTRLRYRLTGNYRGPVEGQASVEWRRSGSHYQVFMDVSIGPPFAPLITRHVGSDGEITPAGLYPQRYDEETRVLLREPRHLTVWLDPDRVRLADGRAVLRPPGVQDSASQFVQLTWLFTTQPELLQTGAVDRDAAGAGAPCRALDLRRAGQRDCWPRRPARSRRCTSSRAASPGPAAT